MPCPHDNLPLLANGRLSGPAKWRTERHVKSCSGCTAELARLSSLSRQLRTLTLSEPSADLDERILAIGNRRAMRRRQPARISLRGFLFALPLVTAILAICLSLPIVRQIPLEKPQVVATVEIAWNPELSHADSRRETLLTDINNLRIDRNTQNVTSSGNLHANTTTVHLRENIVKGKGNPEVNFRRWMENISKYGYSHKYLWTAKVIQEPKINDLSELKMRLLFSISVAGFLIGGTVSLTICLLRMGGLPSVIPFVVIGAICSLIFDTYQSTLNRKSEFHAEGILIVHSEKTLLWSEDAILRLSNSEDVLNGLQDKEKNKIRVLSMERRTRPFSFRYSANGLFSNYTAGTVNLWMRRVQERLLKEWKEKEHPSRVDEMNPPVRVIEADDTAISVSLGTKKSTLALGLFLGLFLGGIYGYFYRGIPKKSADHEEYRERHQAVMPSYGENPMRIPLSIFVGVSIGSSLAMLVTLFQPPVYQSTGRVFVKSKKSSDLMNVVELAKAYEVSHKVMERFQESVPVVVEPIEKTTILQFRATTDNPDLAAQAANETMRGTLLMANKTELRVLVIDAAAVPSQPISPNKPGSIVFGAGLGGLLGMCFGILRRR